MAMVVKVGASTGGHAEEVGGQGAGRGQGGEEADRDTDCDDAGALGDDHAADGGGCGAEGHADADLAGALGDRAGEDAVEAHRAEEEGQGRDDAEGEDGEGELDHRAGGQGVHGVEAVHRGFRGDLADQGADFGGDRFGARGLDHVARGGEGPGLRGGAGQWEVDEGLGLVAVVELDDVLDDADDGVPVLLSRGAAGGGRWGSDPARGDSPPSGSPRRCRAGRGGRRSRRGGRRGRRSTSWGSSRRWRRSC